MSNGTGVSRDYLAKKWFQFRIALAYLAVIAAGSALMAAVLVPKLGKALRLEMYRGHSTIRNTWELLLPDVLTANVVATALVILLAAGITAAILASVHRAARLLARDLRAASCGGDPSAWEPLRRPREFRHLQKLLAEGIRGQRKHLGEMDALCAEILGRVRDARASAPECRELRTLHVLCERLRSHERHIRTE